MKLCFPVKSLSDDMYRHNKAQISLLKVFGFQWKNKAVLFPAQIRRYRRKYLSYCENVLKSIATTCVATIGGAYKKMQSPYSSSFSPLLPPSSAAALPRRHHCLLSSNIFGMISYDLVWGFFGFGELYVGLCVFCGVWIRLCEFWELYMGLCVLIWIICLWYGNRFRLFSLIFDLVRLF